MEWGRGGRGWVGRGVGQDGTFGYADMLPDSLSSKPVVGVPDAKIITPSKNRCFPLVIRDLVLCNSAA